MDYRQWQERVVARLDRLLDRKAKEFGGKHAILKRFGLPKAFFGELRQFRTRTPLDRLFPIIELLGERPAVLLYRAAQDLDESLPGLEGEPEFAEEDPLAQRILAAAAEPQRDGGR